MKPSEMTNEELAGALMSRVPLDGDRHDDLRGGAARLRKYDGIEERMRQVFKSQFEMRDAIIDALRAKLKVAGDALTDAIAHIEIRKNNEYDDDEVVSACEKSIAKCNKALAAVCEEGVANA